MSLLARCPAISGALVFRLPRFHHINIYSQWGDHAGGLMRKKRHPYVPVRQYPAFASVANLPRCSRNRSHAPALLMTSAQPYSAHLPLVFRDGSGNRRRATAAAPCGGVHAWGRYHPISWVPVFSRSSQAAEQPSRNERRVKAWFLMPVPVMVGEVAHASAILPRVPCLYSDAPRPRALIILGRPPRRFR